MEERNPSYGPNMNANTLHTQRSNTGRAKPGERTDEMRNIILETTTRY